MQTLLLHSRQIHVWRVGLLGQWIWDSRVTALGMWRRAGGPLCLRVTGGAAGGVAVGPCVWECVFPEAPVCAEELGSFWVRRLCVFVHVWKSCVFTEWGFKKPQYKREIWQMLRN